MASYSGVHAEVARRGRWIAQEFRRITGRTLTLTSGRRDSKKQAALYAAWQRKDRGALPANRPGTSPHEFGFALDYSPGVAYNTAQWKQLFAIYWQLARAAGFRVIGATDPVHIEVEGWQRYAQ